MARIRTIKPEFATSEQVAECSPTARLLFVELWCFCDDYGNHPASPMRAKAECFPYDPFTKKQMAEWIGELIANGLLIEYTGDDGVKYWHVTGWKHQKIDKPCRKFAEFVEGSSNGSRRVVEDQPAEGKGREGKGSNICAKLPIGTPAKFQVDSQMFDQFWQTYPRRNGRLRGKKQSLDKFKKLSAADQASCVTAAANYARQCKSSDEFPKDPERFLVQGRWREWLGVDPTEYTAEEMLTLVCEVPDAFDSVGGKFELRPGWEWNDEGRPVCQVK